MKLSTFQLLVLVAFGMLTLGGVAIFAMSGGINGSGGAGQVTIWGTADDDTMQSLLATMRQADKATFDKVQYIRKNQATYATDLVNAMASGSGAFFAELAPSTGAHFIERDRFPQASWCQLSCFGSW
jgi:hypothetical protein